MLPLIIKYKWKIKLRKQCVTSSQLLHRANDAERDQITNQPTSIACQTKSTHKSTHKRSLRMKMKINGKRAKPSIRSIS